MAPNITEYDPTIPAVRPSEVGVESQAAAGRRIGGFYSQIAGGLTEAGTRVARGLTEAGDAAVRYEDHKQIAAGAATGAQLFADQLEKKDAAIKSIDPNDPQYGQKVETVVKQWREQQLEPALQEWQSQFTTQRAQDWALSHVNGVRQTMFVHSTADIANAAGIGIHNSARTLVNTATTTAFSHPEMLDSQIDLVDHGLTGLVQSTPVKGVEAARIQSETMERAKEQIVKSAVQGAIMHGGNWQQIAKDPRYSQYINASEAAQFERAERGQARFNLAQEKAIQVYNRQLATESLKTDADEIYAKYHHVTPEGREYYDPQYGTELNALASNGKYKDAPDKAAFINNHLTRFEHLENAHKAVTDQGIFADLNGRIISDKPTTDMEIDKAQADALQGKPGINSEAASILKNMIKLRDANPETKEPAFKYATQQVKAKLEGNNPVAKLHSAGKFSEFMQDFMTRYINGRQTGMLPPNALDLSDPQSLISQTLKSHVPNLGQNVQMNGGIGVPLKTGPIAPPIPKSVPQASM